MSFFRALRTLVYGLVSELEALYVSPPGPVPIRKKYLRLMGMKTPAEMWVGRHALFVNAWNLHVGNRFAVGDNTIIAAHAPVRIGQEFTGASGLHIDSGTHDVETFEPGAAEIVIGDRVWCGIGVKILAGARIGNDCVIGAGSVVKGEIPDKSLAVGVPARVVRSIRLNNPTVWSHFDPQPDVNGQGN